MCNEERKPHKHAALIKAWAEGAVIQYRSIVTGQWTDAVGNRPAWEELAEYRIKPAPIKTETFVRWWWDKNMLLARPEYEYDKAGTISRQNAVQNWSCFGGWLSDWETRTFTVEVE